MPIRAAACLLLATALLPLVPARAQRIGAQSAVTFFNEAQDMPAFTPDEMAARAKLVGDDPEALAADVALNEWKACVADALVHWAPLNQGPGTLIDGAFGRCADLERQYRMHLMRITQGGRQVVDVQMARGMTRTLQESWRPRLVAVALDQALAKQAEPAPPPARR